jgi:hypothetical protein
LNSRGHPEGKADAEADADALTDEAEAEPDRLADADAEFEADTEPERESDPEADADPLDTGAGVDCEAEEVEAERADADPLIWDWGPEALAEPLIEAVERVILKQQHADESAPLERADPDEDGAAEIELSPDDAEETLDDAALDDETIPEIVALLDEARKK